MVVPYGFGVGDFIAVTRLIATIVSELKKNSEAAAEYQNLIVELEALSRALSKLNDIRPAKHELHQLDAIRAVASACERQLESFLGKISRFEKTLGVYNAKDKRYEGLGRRMQWNVAFADDAKELKAALASHVLTINMLLMSQALVSVTTAETDRESFATNLESKIDKHYKLLEIIAKRQSAMNVDLSDQKEAIKGLQALSKISQPLIPPDLSFVVRFDSLRIDYSVQETRSHMRSLRFWVPPTTRNCFYQTTGPLFRWIGGKMDGVAEDDPIRHQTLSPHSSATVFTQNPDTDHLLAVDFDARTRTVAHEPGGWKVLSFDHIARDGQSTYASVNLLGAEQHLAAPESPDCMPQLLSNLYNYCAVKRDGTPFPSTTVSAGLVGSLPLLLAMAAFSAPAEKLAYALDCIQPGVWRPHGLPSGRNVRERGMVVTIYYDPANPKSSNRSCLLQLEKGSYGPFYH